MDGVFILKVEIFFRKGLPEFIKVWQMTGNIPICFPMTAARNEETEKLRLII